MKLKNSFVMSPKEPTRKFGLSLGGMEWICNRYSIRSILSHVCTSRQFYFLAKDMERHAVCVRVDSQLS